MTITFDRLLQWSPRVLGILVSLFFGLFALDAFGGGQPWLTAAADFAIHLIPSVMLLAIVVASWRRPWIGAAAFIALAVAYAATTSTRHLDWVVAISGPLLVVGTLFLWNWVHDRRVA